MEEGYRPGGKKSDIFPDDLAHPFRVRDRETYFKAGRHGHLTICIAMNLRALSVILLWLVVGGSSCSNSSSGSSLPSR